MRLNRLEIIGRLGRDAELKYTQSGKAVLSMNVAVSSFRKDGDPTWISVSVWEKRAEALGKLSLTKGTPVYAAGEVSVRTWEGRDGEIRAGLQMNARDLELLGSRKERSARPDPGDHPLEKYADAFGDDDIPF